MAFEVKKISKKKKNNQHVVRKIFLSLAVTIFGFLLIGVVFVVAQIKHVIELKEEGTVNQEQTKDCGPLGCIGDYIVNQGCNIKSTDRRTNFLLLGMGGKKHIQGGEGLTDTILVVSISHETKEVSMISLPRDLWVKPPNIQPNKINTLHKISTKVYGGDEYGYILPKTTIESMLDMQIHYFALVDFYGVKDIINALGGVDVDVERAFTDKQYPDGNFGYQTISFEEGVQLMDGEKALQYIRSRHAPGESGDFFRSKRQHRLLQALKSKAMSFSTLFKIQGIFEAAFDNSTTNITMCEIIRLAAIAPEFNTDVIHSLTLDDGPNGVLYTPTMEIREASYNGQYVLLPDGNNYKIIGDYVRNFLTEKTSTLPPTKVAVLNGTGLEGIANTIGALLTANGFEVVKRSNTSNRVRFQETKIYDTTVDNRHLDATAAIKTVFGGVVSDTNPEPLTHGADILFIIGADFNTALIE